MGLVIFGCHILQILNDMHFDHSKAAEGVPETDSAGLAQHLRRITRHAISELQREHVKQKDKVHTSQRERNLARTAVKCTARGMTLRPLA